MCVWIHFLLLVPLFNRLLKAISPISFFFHLSTLLMQHIKLLLITLSPLVFLHLSIASSRVLNAPYPIFVCFRICSQLYNSLAVLRFIVRRLSNTTLCSCVIDTLFCYCPGSVVWQCALKGFWFLNIFCSLQLLRQYLEPSGKHLITVCQLLFYMISSIPYLRCDFPLNISLGTAFSTQYNFSINCVCDQDLWIDY